MSKPLDDETPIEAVEDGPGRSNRRLIFILPVLVFLGLAGLFAYQLGSGNDPSKVPSALIGRAAPDFDLAALPGVTVDGKPIPGLSRADLTRGEVTVVNFWAFWCAPCQQEHPLLMQLAQEKGFRLVGIDYKDNPENARRFLGSRGNPFSAIGVDDKGRTAIDFGVYGVPETFIVGPDGTIRYKHVGPLTPETLPGFLAEIRKAKAS